MSAEGRSAALPRTRIELRWERNDRHRIATWVGLGLAAVAVALAVIGLPPVDLHGPLHKVGIMDPLCGGTRAARYVMQGDLVQAWRYNPLSIVVVALSIAVALRAVVGLVGRRWLTWSLRMSPRARWTVRCVIVGLVVLLEIRQQMRAELLMEGTVVL